MLDPSGLQSSFKPVQGDLNKVGCFLSSLAGTAAFRISGSGVLLNYAFRKKGKLLRPALVLLSASAAAKSRIPSHAVRLAGFCELIHTASLIHDDVVDDEAERRGQKVLNRVFGNKQAVLAGDLLFTWSLKRIAAEFDSVILDGYLACVNDMCAAEISFLRRKPRTRRAYEAYLSGKTASLMEAACSGAAHLVRAPAPVVKALSDYGRSFGLAYQLLDDSLDGDTPLDFPFDYAERIGTHIRAAHRSLARIPESPARRSLETLAGLVLSGRKTA